jgi:hypothetical protein
MRRVTNDSSNVPADAFECLPCASIQANVNVEMTNCTAPGVTLDTIPLAPGHWRQSPRARYVRVCDFEEACLGGELAGDASCLDGHTGPLCDLCVKDPLHFGGRGAPCQRCSDLGDPVVTIALYAVGGVVVLVAIVLVTAICKRRGVLSTVTKTEGCVEDKVRVATGALKTAIKTEAIELVKKAFGLSDATLAMLAAVKAKAESLLAFIASQVADLGVKTRILLSLFQVVSQMGVSFNITYPSFYIDVLDILKGINIPIDLLPFGCVFPWLNNFLFDFILKTATPLALVLLLAFLSKVLRARSGSAEGAHVSLCAFLADACSDLWFFIIFLMYPSCSSMTFMFFMREEYEEPGEVYVDLMRADRSINRDEPVYQGFTAYALIMVAIYPIGVPALYGLMFHRARHQLLEMRRIELTGETDFALAKLGAESAATPEETDEMVRRAMEVHEENRRALAKLRGELPTTLRKLTAGYELRTYWFEVFECVRKIGLIGLPIFFPVGSPAQLIFGLIICFLSYGAYCVCSPYIKDQDDFLAQVAQFVIFFSLVGSLVTNAFPDDPVMSIALPGLLSVPVILTFIFQSPLLEQLRSFTEPDDQGNVGLAGHWILAFRYHIVRITDRLIGAVKQEDAQSETRAKWRQQGSASLHVFKGRGYKWHGSKWHGLFKRKGTSHFEPGSMTHMPATTEGVAVTMVQQPGMVPATREGMWDTLSVVSGSPDGSSPARRLQVELEMARARAELESAAAAARLQLGAHAKAKEMGSKLKAKAKNAASDRARAVLLVQASSAEDDAPGTVAWVTVTKVASPDCRASRD